MATIMILDLHRGLKEVEKREAEIRLVRLRKARFEHAGRHLQRQLEDIEGKWDSTVADLENLTGVKLHKDWADIIHSED
jgi:hypothetical protein